MVKLGDVGHLAPQPKPHLRQGPGTAMGVPQWLQGGWGERGGSEVVAALALAGQPVEGVQCRPVALVEPLHAVALVMDVVGDVLQVLQMGSVQGGKGSNLHTPPPSCPRCGVLSPASLTHRISRSRRRGNSQCAGFSTARQGQQAVGWVGRCWVSTSQQNPGTTGAPARLHATIRTHPGWDAPTGASPHAPADLGRAGGGRGCAHLQ